MKKKVLALWLCLTALALCACGGGNTAQPDANAESVTEQTDAESAAEQSEQRDAQQAQEAALQSEQPQSAEGETPDGERAYRAEELTLKIGDDDIYGVMYLPLEEKETYPTVILSHGFGGTADTCKPYCEIFAANGYACYALDFRGGGNNSRSSGSTTEMSVLTEAADLTAVLEQVRALDYVDESQVFLWGESQGGFVSSYVAANRPDDVKALILYYPAFVLQDDAREKYPNPNEIPEVEDVWGTRLGAVYNLDAMSFDIYEVIGNYKGDVLIVHGDKDEVVPLSYSERAVTVYESANLVVFEGGGHGFWDRVDEAAAYSLEFLQAHTA